MSGGVPIFVVMNNAKVTVKNLKYYTELANETENILFAVAPGCYFTLDNMECFTTDYIRDEIIFNAGGNTTIIGENINAFPQSGEGLFVNTSGGNLTIKGNGKYGVYYDSFAPIIASETTLDGVDDETENITIENGTFDSAIGIFAYGKGNVIIKNGTFNVSQGVFVVPSIGIKTKFAINNIIANCDVGFLIEQSSLENKIDFQNGKVTYLLGWLSINTESAPTPVQDIIIRNGKFGPKDGTTDIFDELDNYKVGGVSVTAISKGGYTYQIGTDVSPNPESGSSQRRVIPNTGIN